MNEPNKLYVYHGSHELFDLAIPKRQIRKGLNPDPNGEKYITVFDDISFHATPYKLIALNYICQCQNILYLNFFFICSQIYTCSMPIFFSLI
jgi:hypothetical protein